MKSLTKKELEAKLQSTLELFYSVKSIDDASNLQIYKALAKIIVAYLREKQNAFITQTVEKGGKQVYYISMEFLMGRSLKTNLYNLGLEEAVSEILAEHNIKLDSVCNTEPDAALGNGGLGRLAACYLDGLATCDYPATGYSICYEHGIFKQKLENGKQVELPDNWLYDGEVWLDPSPDQSVDGMFDGWLDEYWDGNYHCVKYMDYTTVRAVPYDMYVPGYHAEGVSKLRLWKAEMSTFDMKKFNDGNFMDALGINSVSHVISKVLYPNDNNMEGKSLRLRQQYFMCAASVGDITAKHLTNYGTLDNLGDKVAIHVNDTHPTLAIPELMRILLDECGYSWEKAWDITTKTFAYTNHTVMAEALEKWDRNLFQKTLPRIYNIVVEITNRQKDELYKKGASEDVVKDLSIIDYDRNVVKMANLCAHASYSINGVSSLHSEIIKTDVFENQYKQTPERFTNVTNGIAYRRWLLQSNPGLTSLLSECIGDDFKKHSERLADFRKFEDDETVLKRLAQIKLENKERLAKYVKKHNGIIINPNSIFDVQVKRMHEYKRQHLNALNILSDFMFLLENPDADFVPKTYIFGAKSAPGYEFAKNNITFLWSIGEEIKKHPKIAEKLNVVYLEDYRVTLSELIMPASEMSEQISLAGTEASGTGNMKFMLNGAITIGTYDGANVEINGQVGDENMFKFGMSAQEVVNLQKRGYNPEEFMGYNDNLKKVIDMLYKGFNGTSFAGLADYLKRNDRYMALADFGDYQRAQNLASETYKDILKWNKMSLVNIAGAGLFSADRAVTEYAKNIWKLD